MQPTALRTPLASPAPLNAADNELMKLRGRAASATPYPELLKTLNAAELKYPRDYRFSYERAKLTVKTDRSRKHAQSFALLALAARKAIDSGRSGEMLDSLKTDMRHDLQGLSREHDEWRLLEQALKRNDKRILEKTT